MTLSVSDLQSDSDLDSIRNSCDVFRLCDAPFISEYHLHHGDIAESSLFNIARGGLLILSDQVDYHSTATML